VQTRHLTESTAFRHLHRAFSQRERSTNHKTRPCIICRFEHSFYIYKISPKSEFVFPLLVNECSASCYPTSSWQRRHELTPTKVSCTQTTTFTNPNTNNKAIVQILHKQHLTLSLHHQVSARNLIPSLPTTPPQGSL
jgi:hypothetical protein